MPDLANKSGVTLNSDEKVRHRANYKAYAVMAPARLRKMNSKTVQSNSAKECRQTRPITQANETAGQ
jgi:hypothetical protein